MSAFSSNFLCSEFLRLENFLEKSIRLRNIVLVLLLVQMILETFEFRMCRRLIEELAQCPDVLLELLDLEKFYLQVCIVRSLRLFSKIRHLNLLFLVRKLRKHFGIL